MELLAKELFLGCVRGSWDVSLSQDARRTGLCCCGGMYGTCRRGSISSSELAIASESGVDLRTFNLSSSKDWLLGAKPDGPPLGGLLGFPLVELILREELSRVQIIALRRLKL